MFHQFFDSSCSPRVTADRGQREHYGTMHRRAGMLGPDGAGEAAQGGAGAEDEGAGVGEFQGSYEP